MRYPTPSAYQESVQFPATAFADPELQRAEPEWTPLGLPKSITGAFAVVFKMNGASGTLAVRCPLAEIPDATSRYARLESMASELSGYVPSRYIERGIQVDGQWWPTVVMPWIDALPFHRYVAKWRTHPDMLLACEEALAGVMAAWHEAGIAHGDLQHGNVLVEGDRPDALRVWLIDYDAVGFGPKATTTHEAGHRNYTHPEAPASPLHRDQFALLVMRTALRAVAAEPSWWDVYDSGENLLFSASDLYDPGRSPLFSALLAHPEVESFARLLAAAALGAASRIPAWEASQGVHIPLPLLRSEGRTAKPGWNWLTLGPTLGLILAGWWLGYLAGIAALSWLLVRFALHPETQRGRRTRAALRLLRRDIRQAEAQIQAVEAEIGQVRSGLEQARQARLRAVRDEYLESCLKHHLTGEVLDVEGVSFKAMVRIKGAGIRNAWMATPERLAQVSDLAEATRVQVGFWRNSLIATYAAGCPVSLSEAELRRLGRQREHRLNELAGEQALLVRRLEALALERDQVTQKMGASTWRSIRRLVFEPHPEQADAPAPRTAPQGTPIALD